LHKTPLADSREAKVKDIQGGFVQEIQAAVLLPPRYFPHGRPPLYAITEQNLLADLFQLSG
jgi:hypothetical protein